MGTRPHAQVKEFRDYKVVTADWIVKSIEAGKLYVLCSLQVYLRV